MDPVVAQIAGLTVTVGLISSVLAQLAKALPGFKALLAWVGARVAFVGGTAEDTGRRWTMRAVVACICVLVSEGLAWLSGSPLVVANVWTAFLAYLGATAAYEHLFAD